MPTLLTNSGSKKRSLPVRRQPALFLDRDGVINVDYGYVHSRENFQFLDGIFDVVRAARSQGYLIVVVTNQAGIGRGLYGEEDFQTLTDWMCNRFVEEKARIDRVFFSPYHPTEGRGYYKQDHFSRKPRPGMLLTAEQELNIDMMSSILIGDHLSDIEAGITAGVGTNLLLKDDGTLNPLNSVYTQIGSLHEALPFIIT